MMSKESSIVAINQEKRVIVKKKNQKFKGSEAEFAPTDTEDSKKAQGFRIHEGGKSKLVYLPIWQQWGNRINNSSSKQLGYVNTQKIFGNHLSGLQWVEDQKKRQQQKIFQPGEIKQIQNTADEQIIYIEPSISEKRLNQLRKIGRKFYDENFAPNEYSLTGTFGHVADWQPIRWKKISATIPSAQIFCDKANPNDIVQGFLGDCYFLAGLAALAERADRIFNLFLLQEKNQLAYYSVKILYRGKWRTVDLDENIPYILSEPAFSKSVKNELWVMILEKAWAKIYGSYKQIEAGYPEEPLHDLTGAPVRHLFLTHKSFKTDEEWKYLLESSKKQYAMVASSKPGSDADESPSGIIQGHAYTFLNATEILVNGKTQRIVQLRNPWGKGEFKGRWSDGDPVWNLISASEKDRVKYKDQKFDGVFFMSYDDFTFQFRNLAIAEINDNASYVYESFYDPHNNGAYFTIDILHNGAYSFQVDKTPQRSFSAQKQRKYQYPEAWLEIGKLEQSQVQRYQGFISRRRTLFKSYDLKPGKYVAWVKVEFDPQFQEDFEVNLAIYSEYSCSIKIASRIEAVKFSGDQKIKWTGDNVQKKQVGLPSPAPSNENNGKNHNSSWANNLHFTYHDFTSKQITPKKQITTGANIEPSKGFTEETKSPLNNNNIEAKPDNIEARPETEMKKKKVRKIEVRHTKIQTYEQSQNGEAIIKTTQKQTKRETLETNEADGVRTRVKELENNIETIELQQRGETLNKKKTCLQKVKISQRKPDGKVIEKVETREMVTETVEESDNGSSSFLRSAEQRIKQMENENNEENNKQNEHQKSESDNKANFQRQQNQLDNTRSLHSEKNTKQLRSLQNEREAHDLLRYEEPGSEANSSRTSYININ